MGNEHGQIETSLRDHHYSSIVKSPLSFITLARSSKTAPFRFFRAAFCRTFRSLGYRCFRTSRCQPSGLLIFLVFPRTKHSASYICTKPGTPLPFLVIVPTRATYRVTTHMHETTQYWCTSPWL